MYVCKLQDVYFGAICVCLMEMCVYVCVCVCVCEGLVAVRSDDVLEVMSEDFPEKCVCICVHRFTTSLPVCVYFILGALQLSLLCFCSETKLTTLKAYFTPFTFGFLCSCNVLS